MFSGSELISKNFQESLVVTNIKTSLSGVRNKSSRYAPDKVIQPPIHNLHHLSSYILQSYCFSESSSFMSCLIIIAEESALETPIILWQTRDEDEGECNVNSTRDF